VNETTGPWGGWDDATRDDPYELFASVREAGPVHHVDMVDGHDAWLVIGHDAARAALNDERLSKDMQAAKAFDPDIVSDGLPGPAFARHMLAVDPPDHTRLRGLVAPAFGKSRIAALEPAVERIADMLLDELEGRGNEVVDLVHDYALPLPFAVIGALLGIPPVMQPQLHDWFRTLLQPWSVSPPADAVAASDAIVETLAELVDLHRDHPADDLIGVLVTASDEGDQLTDQEVLSTLFQLIVAGHDTTTSLIGNGIVDLLDHPDDLRLLAAEPDRIPDAVEEMLRFSAPVPHATFRVTTEAVSFDGVEIPAHEQVLVCIAGANRDPAVRDEPTSFDVTRPPRHHLGFGHGIHFCLGAPLARLEGRIAFAALLRRFPDLRLAVPREDLAWSHGDGLVLRGLAALPVRLGS
jgi:cytochrome P450